MSLLILVPLNHQTTKAIVATSTKEQSFSGWGPGFLGLAVAPNGKTAYIPFSLDDALLIVDLSTYKVTGSIDVSAAGIELDSGAALITPDGKKLYISNFGAGNVMVIDTARRSVVKILPLKPSAPVVGSMSQDGSKVYVPSSDGSLYRINTTDDTYERIFVPGVIFGPVMHSPSHSDILYSPGILVELESGIFRPTFFEFDLVDKTVKRTVPLPEDPSQYPITSVRRLAVSSDDHMAYFGRYILGAADKGVGNFYAIDLQSFQIASSMPIDNGVADFAINEAKNKIYLVGCWSGGGAPERQNIQEWDISARKVVRRISVSPTSDQRAIVIDPTNANCLYMTEGDFNLLRKVEISTGKELGSVKFHQDNIRPYVIIPNGNTGYIVSNFTQDINIMNLQSGQLTGSIHVPVSFFGSGFYKGKIYVGGGDRIRAINPLNGAIVKEYPVGFNTINLFFTFFGNKMATIDYKPGGMIAKQLLIFNAEKMSILKAVKLPAEPFGQRVLASPDGSKLYLESGPMWGAPTVITILDSTTFKTLSAISIPPANLRHGGTGFLDGVFDEKKRVLYLLGFTSVYMIQMDNNSLLGTLDLIDVYEKRGRYGWPPTGLSGLMLSGSGDELFVISGDAHSMYTYNIKNSSWNTRITNFKGYFTTTATASPDKRYLFTANSRSDSVTMIDTKTGTISKIINLTKKR